MTSPLPIPALEAVAERRTPDSLLDPIILYGTFTLLLFGPLAFGAVEPWSIFVLESGTALLFSLWAIRQYKSGEVRVDPSPLFPPTLAFAALVLIQLVIGHTAYRYATFSQARQYVAYGLLCFLVVQSLRRTAQVKNLTIVFSAYGAALAGFALVQGMASNGKLYWLRTPRFGGWIYGPYVNHNHYAGLMEMLLPIPLVFFLTSHARGPRKILAGIAAAIMATTIFLSGSRGGMAAFAVQMAVLLVVLLRKQKPGKSTVALGIFLIVMVGLLAWLGGGELTKRMASIHKEAAAELSGGTRWDINRDGLKMFAMKPILGWGLGVFPEVYPQYRSFYTTFFINEAHNDYLQLLIETGALGFATMLWFLTAMYSSALKKLRNSPADTNGAVTLAALLAVTGILVHSFVDFNLQIPANAALFYVFCAIVAMEPRFSLSRRKARSRREPAPSE
jgi:O-antigen ligase